MAERNGQTVTVACKMPHGLVLRLFEKVDQMVQGSGGLVVEKLPRPVGSSVTVAGYLDRYNPALPPAAVGSKYAFTDRVSKDFWDAWLEQNRQHDAVRNHLIFAHESPEAARRMAADREKETRSGLEPILPERDLLPVMKKAAAA